MEAPFNRKGGLEGSSGFKALVVFKMPRKVVGYMGLEFSLRVQAGDVHRGIDRRLYLLMCA